MAALGFIFWQATRPRTEPPPPVVKILDNGPPAPVEATPQEIKPEKELSPAEIASARAAAMAEEVAEIARLPEDGSAGQAPPELDAKLIEVGRQLRGSIGKRARLGVRLYQVRASDSGKTLYLEFGSTRESDAICARYRTDLGIFTEEQLKKHIGKRLYIQGKVVADPSGRVAIELDDEDSLEIDPG